MTTKTTVFVVDDDPAARESLTELARSMQLDVACYRSAEEFLGAYDSSRQGCLVLEVVLPGIGGIELLERLEAAEIRLPILIVTGHGDVPMVVRAMQQGAIDFLEKPPHPSHLRDSIRKAIQQDTLWRQERSRRQDLEARLARLAPDELEVMRRIVAGKTNRGIAEELDVSVRTIQFRRSAIMEKMQVKSRSDLMELVLATPGWKK